MNRPFVCFICIVGFFLVPIQGTLAQSPELLKRIPPEALQQFSSDEQAAIQSRVEALASEGKSEDEILTELKSEGLIPGSFTLPNVTPSGSTGGGEAEDPQEIVQPETDAALPEPADASEPEPLVVVPPMAALNISPSAIYGQHIFQSPVQFNKALSSAPSYDYIIAPGDIFAVNVWDCSEYTESLVVDNDGSVRAKFLGKVYVGGLTYGKAREILMSRFRNILSRCSQVEIFIGSSQRSISVNIVGEVKQPGAYKINAAMPAFNALFEAGGVTEIGTVRKILIKRGDKIVKTLDIYDYLIDGKNEPIYLQDNDFIFVPVQEKIVRLSGEVKRPMRYELLPNENLHVLLEFAGGLKPSALRSSARVSRPNEERQSQLDIVLATYLDPEGMDFSLLDGDQLVIRPKKGELKNIASISGRVGFPDQYELKPEERVSDLIQRAGGLEPDAFLQRAYVIRFDSINGRLNYLSIDLSRLDLPENNLTLQYGDALQIFSEKNFQENRLIAINGKVKNPGVFAMSREMTLKDLLYQAGGTIENLHIQELEFYRQLNPLERGINNLGNGQEEITRIPIQRDWQNSVMADTMKLWGFRQVVVRCEEDFVRFGTVEIKGYVNGPGTYEVLPDMSLKDILYLAEGLRLEADYENIELSRVLETIDENGEIVPVPIVINRVSTIQNWREDERLDSIFVNSFDQIFVRRNPDFLLQESVYIAGEVRSPGEYHKLAKNERLSSLVSRSGGINDIAYLKGAILNRPSIGIISIKLDEALRNPGGRKDIFLLEGDILSIPPRQDVVTITGNVLEPGTKVVYENNIRSFRYYVRQAGGFDSKSKRRHSTVRYVNGRVKRAHSILGFKIYPKVEQGSILNVPQKSGKQDKEKDDKKRGEREPLNLQEIFAGAASVLTFWLLIDRTLN